MASRRKLPMMGYGSADIPATRGGMSALPPPPDGSIPNRLPVGIDPQQAAPQGNPNMMQMQGGSGGDSQADPFQMMLRLLQQANGQQ